MRTLKSLNLMEPLGLSMQVPEKKTDLYSRKVPFRTYKRKHYFHNMITQVTKNTMFHKNDINVDKLQKVHVHFVNEKWNKTLISLLIGRYENLFTLKNHISSSEQMFISPY